VLVPFTFQSAPGYGGSRWSTELWVHNEADHDVSLTPKICSGLFGLEECDVAPLIVASKGSLLVPSGQFYWMTPGTYYAIPRAEADQLSFDLRLLDETHPDTSATSIPVVRVQPRTKLVLLNVPNDGHGRMLLRAYGFTQDFAVHVYDLDSGERLADELIEYWLPTDIGGGPTYPGFAAQSSAIFDVPAVRKARRLRVEIENARQEFSTFMWAIITITSCCSLDRLMPNDQEPTGADPQGALGNERCRPGRPNHPTLNSSFAIVELYGLMSSTGVPSSMSTPRTVSVAPSRPRSSTVVCAIGFGR